MDKISSKKAAQHKPPNKNGARPARAGAAKGARGNIAETGGEGGTGRHGLWPRLFRSEVGGAPGPGAAYTITINQE